ncbi:MAG: fibronectin type III domain-containing protein [Gammaproteobacteria bacterium]|nr:fibronectin type III domain-containing protein [Gammaproteobacteria bacterium]
MHYSARSHGIPDGVRTCRFPATFVYLCLITACGGGSPSSPFDGGDATQLQPPPVSSVSASGTDGGIVVDWFGSITATGYNVYWSDTPGVTQQSGTRATFSLPPGTITGLTNGTTYYAIVTATNDNGESAASNEVQAVAMLQPPPAVIGVKAEPGDGDATIEWFDQADADSYSVFWGTNPSGGGTEITGATSPFVVTGLTNSETYYLSVAGNNAAGQGAASQVVEATPVAAVPGWTAQTEINTPFSGIANDLELEDVAINDSGVAAALWTSSEGFFGSLKRIVVNHTASGSWGEQLILANAGSSASVAVTPAGDIHVASDEGATVRTRRNTNDAWSDATVIRNGSAVANSFGVKLAADGQGNVFLCWVEDTFPAGTDPLRSTHRLWVARFDANTEAWGAPELISTSLSWIRSPRITAGAANTAIVAWLQDSVEHDPTMQNPPDRRVVYASRYDGVAWQSAAVVGRNDLVDFDSGDELALNGNAGGSAVVTWTQTRSATGTPDAYQVEAVRYDAQLSQWSAPENIVDGTTQAIVPNVTLDGASASLAAWINGTDTVVSGSTFDPVASLWGVETDIPTDILGAREPYGIDGDEAGSLVVAWAKDFQVPKGIFVRRQEAGSGTWGTTAHLGGRVGDELLFEMSGSGYAIVVTKTQVTQRESRNNVVYGTIYTP